MTDSLSMGSALAPPRSHPREAARRWSIPSGWQRLVAALTDPREARAQLHALDLRGVHRTWT